MNKLLVALIAGALAFVSASVLAQAPAPKPKPATHAIEGEGDLMPLSKMDTEQAKAARAAAKAKWDAMTPEEQAALKKKIANKRVQDLTATEAIAANQGPVFDAAQAKKDAAVSKALPKPTAAERQKDLSQQSKGVTGQ
jgi:hypothetical protein